MWSVFCVFFFGFVLSFVDMNSGSTEQTSVGGGATADMPKDMVQSDTTHEHLQGEGTE